jgi:methylglyoxal synthase
MLSILTWQDYTRDVVGDQTVDLRDAMQNLRVQLALRWITPESLLREADQDRNGQIDLGELIDFIHQLQIHDLNLPTIEAILNLLDRDGNGVLDRTELAGIFSGTTAIDALKQDSRVRTTPRLEPTLAPRMVSLVAHNNMKPVLLDFVAANLDFFRGLPLVTTRSTGRALKRRFDIHVQRQVASGPLGGDQAIGGLISEHHICAIFFFKDPLSSHAHASDIDALTRLCDVHRIPFATNAASALGLIMAIDKLGLSWDLNATDSRLVRAYKEEQSGVVAHVLQ